MTQSNDMPDYCNHAFPNMIPNGKCFKCGKTYVEAERQKAFKKMAESLKKQKADKDMTNMFPDTVVVYYPAARISAMAVCSELFQKDFPHSVYVRQDTPPQSPNRAVLDALNDCRVAVKTGCIEHALAFVEKAITAATQVDEVKVINGLETAFECDTEEKRWAFHDMYNKFPEAVINEAAHEHLKCQKGR